MAAATSDQVRVAWSLPEFPPNEANTILLGTINYQGAVSMLVAGKVRPAASGVAGSTMLGVAMRQYAAPAGADLVLPDGQQGIFRRGVFPFPAVAGNAPTELLINQKVYFADDSTVKATGVADDLFGILRAIAEGFYWVEIS